MVYKYKPIFVFNTLFMKIFKSNQVKLIDDYTIKYEPVKSIELMERAAFQCASWIMSNYSRSICFKIFAGFGNNGGDGLAIARILLMNDYKVEVYLIQAGSELSTDCNLNLEALQKLGFNQIFEINQEIDLPQIDRDDIIIDALFGSGLNRPLEGIFETIVHYLNKINCDKIAIDITSGLNGEGIAIHETVFKANHTLTFQFPFLSFFFAENVEYIGEYHVLDIGLHPDAIKNIQAEFILIDLNDITYNQRLKFGHKGTFGHVLLIAGSKIMTGAAVLSSKAALHSGCGLVTLHAPEHVTSILQTSFPEALVSIDKSDDFPFELPDISKYTTIAIGPGIGVSEKSKNILRQLLNQWKKPLVIDADALNNIASEKEMLKMIPDNSILTPHPREFDRLFGVSTNSPERLQKQINVSAEHNIIIVLKGKYTTISLPNGTCYINSTGNSGMATAGSGDVLTGIIVSMLAQGYKPEQAAITGVYLHGLAGDEAKVSLGEEYMVASDIIRAISKAFNKLKYNTNILQTRL
jgi:NAD(P)H-hydrate epimerase